MYEPSPIHAILPRWSARWQGLATWSCAWGRARLLIGQTICRASLLDCSRRAVSHERAIRAAIIGPDGSASPGSRSVDRERGDRQADLAWGPRARGSIVPPGPRPGSRLLCARVAAGIP